MPEYRWGYMAVIYKQAHRGTLALDFLRIPSILEKSRVALTRGQCQQRQAARTLEVIKRDAEPQSDESTNNIDQSR